MEPIQCSETSVFNNYKTLGEYPEEFLSTNKRYTKFFISLTSAMVLISLVKYRKNTGWKQDHLKLRIHLVESLLLNYSAQHTSDHHGSDTTIQRLRECHFPRGIPPTVKMRKTRWQSEVSSRHDTRSDPILLISLWCCCVRLCVCVCVCFKAYLENITEVM